MKKWHLFLGWIGVSIALAHAQPKNALDPETDPRLNKTVSLRIASLPLKEVASVLREKTGIVFTVEPTIGEYRACLYVPARPLHEVMAHLAEAFGYRWERVEQENRPPAYRLIDSNPPTSRRSPKERVQEFREKILPKLCELLKKPTQERMETAQRLAESAPSPGTLEEWQKVLVIAASVDTTGSPYVYCAMTDDHWNRILRGETLLFGTKRGILLPQNALSDWIAISTERARMSYEFFSGEDSATNKQFLEKLQAFQQALPKADELRVLFRYNSETDKFEMQVAVLAEGKNVLTRWDLDSRLPAAVFIMPKGKEESINEEPPASLPDRPAFKKQLTEYREVLPTEDWFSWLGNLLVQMAEASGVPLVAEIYPFQPRTLYRWADEASRPSISWQKVGGLLHAWDYRLVFPDDQWVVVQSRVRDRAREEDIPQSRLARWFFKPNRRGQLTLDDCAEIATLNPTQIDKLFFYLLGFSVLAFGNYIERPPIIVDPDLLHLHGGLSWAQNTLENFFSDYCTPPFVQGEQHQDYPSGLRWTLKLYASLPSSLRFQLQRGATIPFSALTPQQQQTFLMIWSLDKGGPLMVESLWDTSGSLVGPDEGGLSLVFRERMKRNETVSRELKLRWNSVAEARQWYRTDPEKHDHLQVMQYPIAEWVFQLHWQGQTRSVVLPLEYPLRKPPNTK